MLQQQVLTLHGAFLVDTWFLKYRTIHKLLKLIVIRSEQVVGINCNDVINGVFPVGGCITCHFNDPLLPSFQ